MKKIKFMLLSLALVAVVGGALAFKARYHVPICTTFAQRANAASPWTCQIAGQDILTCPDPIATTVDEPGTDRPVCTTLQVNGTCGAVGHEFQCDLPTKTLVTD
jgi:hypothetical protein